ncbi:VOC family protein [Nocardioides pocheonensis]|uniref:VOC family protein n=1 Tax=Nocardioides pocheonensis TaxID=661485 RepID=A0A3N0GJ34_9ACTN|nr:VOC family protein [Nocardioides pocheonensis]RNM12182.1 VOC family protein [Nocardioides pocheonensis]
MVGPLTDLFAAITKKGTPMNSLPRGNGVPDILGKRMQVSMVVHDLEQAALIWSEHLGVGPWILIEDGLEGRTFMHRGRRSDVQMSLALTYGGETQFELISQSNDAPSPYREFLDGGREGVQHLEFWPEDYAASCRAIEGAGFRELSTIHVADGTKNASYYESPASVGVVVAVVPMTPYRHSYMSAIERLAATWDGTRPIRRFPTRADFLASDDFASVQPESGSAGHMHAHQLQTGERFHGV